MKHLLLIPALAACTNHGRLVDPADTAGHDVTVETTTAPGVEVDATIVPGPYGYVARTQDYGDIPFGNIKQITETKNGLGALQGLGLGILIGATGGAILGYADGDDECESDHCWFALDAGGKAVIGGVVLGALGGIIGLAVGAVRGSRYVYEF